MKRINVRLMNNEREFLKHVSRPTCITYKIFGRNFAAIHEIRPVLTLNKPIYVGFNVLESSKWLMYDFQYNFIKRNFNFELLFTDTDSLCYHFACDVYEGKKIFKWKELFDFSNYPRDLKLLNEKNKKVIEKMKNEFGGKVVK